MRLGCISCFQFLIRLLKQPWLSLRNKSFKILERRLQTSLGGCFSKGLGVQRSNFAHWQDRENFIWIILKTILCLILDFPGLYVYIYIYVYLYIYRCIYKYYILEYMGNWEKTLTWQRKKRCKYTLAETCRKPPNFEAQDGLFRCGLPTRQSRTWVFFTDFCGIFRRAAFFFGRFWEKTCLEKHVFLGVFFFGGRDVMFFFFKYKSV